MKWRKWI